MQTSAQRVSGLGVMMACAAVSILLAGCGGGGGSHAAPLPSGSTCQSIKSRLSQLDAKGVRGSIERQASGAKLSPGAKADADAYNSLLNDYLKARCHEAPH